MIRLTQTKHMSNEASSDQRWFLDHTLRFEVHPIRNEAQVKAWPGARAAVVVHGEAHYVDETPEQVMSLLKVVRHPHAYRLQDEAGHLIAPDDLIWIGMDGEGVLEFGLTEIKG
ncbi:hypothetical protein D869_gp057 [Caulobacter phage CcrRogue]|uniref:Uncharacterized protein n=1 Tax=Caulobacter phage CcrRogue TaxID=2927986 RepID=K4JMW4_9CAUD|nr:hypothetical protein D869_gp057 [Caulobacter phage CcrRogue]AFU86539.1 hypothetical protein CcrRogue_gp057 [Caulobacter phage CcrRogue]